MQPLAAQAIPALEVVQEFQTKQNSSTPSQHQESSEDEPISPRTWAFITLKDIVQRYDCLKDAPEDTFTGTHSVSRWEFAVVLNTCLLAIERTIIEGEITPESIPEEDLEKLRRLITEFESELATLGARVDQLECCTNPPCSCQFLSPHP
ncbi:MAG: hypothetical protein ACPGVO_21940 [Spirulinaceae cyanobacterium]